jgi:hypothetical protein
MTSGTLWAWDADRNPRLVCIDEAPFDDDGEDLMLFDGMSLDERVTINLRLPKKGVVTDFLYSPTLKLFVSSRAMAVIERANVPQIRAHKVVLRDRAGRALDDTYSWLNVMPLVELLDRQRSVFTEREDGGGIKRVVHLAIREDAVPPDDLFLFQELNLAVFSDALVRNLEAERVTGAVFEKLDGLTWPT